MNGTIYRTTDPTVDTVELGAVYRIRSPRTGVPWTLYKVSDESGIDSIEPSEVPTGWDDAYEYALPYPRVWRRLTRLAMDAYLAHAILEVAFVPVDDDEISLDSRALLHRFVWPH